MAQRVYVSAWEAESYVEDGATLHTEDDPIGDAVEFLLLPAEDAESIRVSLRYLLRLVKHQDDSVSGRDAAIKQIERDIENMEPNK